MAKRVKIQRTVRIDADLDALVEAYSVENFDKVRVRAYENLLRKGLDFDIQLAASDKLIQKLKDELEEAKSKQENGSLADELKRIKKVLREKGVPV